MAPSSAAFWTEYKAVLTKLSISEKKSNYYVSWAQTFERFLNGLQFGDASLDMVKAFLADLARDERIKDWQRDQARHALEILYDDYLKVDFKAPVAQQGPFKDAIKDPVVFEKTYDALMRRIEAECRVRHYSMRTLPYVGPAVSVVLQ